MLGYTNERSTRWKTGASQGDSPREIQGGPEYAEDGWFGKCEWLSDRGSQWCTCTCWRACTAHVHKNNPSWDHVYVLLFVYCFCWICHSKYSFDPHFVTNDLLLPPVVKGRRANGVFDLRNDVVQDTMVYHEFISLTIVGWLYPFCRTNVLVRMK